MHIKLGRCKGNKQINNIKGNNNKIINKKNGNKKSFNTKKIKNSKININKNKINVGSIVLLNFPPDKFAIVNDLGKILASDDNYIVSMVKKTM